MIDGPLNSINSKDVLLFPLRVGGNDGTSSRALGNHWTLLKLCLVSCEWSFYNSFKPRNDDGADPHLIGSNVVVS